MKASDLIRQVNRDIDDTYSNADLYDWFNRCLDDLTPIARKEEHKTAEIVGSAFELPSDLHEIVSVEVEDVEYTLIPRKDKNSKGYKVWANELTIQNGPTEGTIDLYYYRKLTHLAAPDDVPEIEEPFHDLFILYAVGHAQFMDEDDRPDVLQRYYQRKDEYEQFKRQQNNDIYEIQNIFY